MPSVFFSLRESKQYKHEVSKKTKLTLIFFISLKFSICWPGLPANKDPCLCPPPSHFCWNPPSPGWDVAVWKLSGQWFPRRGIHSGLKTNHLKVVTAACHSLHAHHKLALANQVWLTFFWVSHLFLCTCPCLLHSAVLQLQPDGLNTQRWCFPPPFWFQVVLGVNQHAFISFCCLLHIPLDVGDLLPPSLQSSSAFRLGAGCKPVLRGGAAPSGVRDESPAEESRWKTHFTTASHTGC